MPRTSLLLLTLGLVFSTAACGDPSDHDIDTDRPDSEACESAADHLAECCGRRLSGPVDCRYEHITRYVNCADGVVDFGGSWRLDEETEIFPAIAPGASADILGSSCADLVAGGACTARRVRPEAKTVDNDLETGACG